MPEGLLWRAAPSTGASGLFERPTKHAAPAAAPACSSSCSTSPSHQLFDRGREKYSFGDDAHSIFNREDADVVADMLNALYGPRGIGRIFHHLEAAKQEERQRAEAAARVRAEEAAVRRSEMEAGLIAALARHRGQ